LIFFLRINFLIKKNLILRNFCPPSADFSMGGSSAAAFGLQKRFWDF